MSGMKAAKLKRMLGVSAALALVGVGVAGVPAMATFIVTEFPTHAVVPARDEAVAWAPGRASDRNHKTGKKSPVRGHTFTFWARIPGACAGREQPEVRVKSVAVVEKPERGNLKATIITVRVHYPEYRIDEEAGQIAGSCDPAPATLKTFRVKTKRPADQLTFFDGSSSPATRKFHPKADRRRGRGCRTPTTQKPRVSGALAHAAEWSRTITGVSTHKALNLARLPVPPQPRGAGILDVRGAELRPACEHPREPVASEQVFEPNEA